MIKIGLIGCGKISQVRHLPEYASNPACQIAGLYDVCLERAQELAKQYGAVAYSSCEELLASDIDAVSICSSNATHAELTIAALRAGKHVLCEKPMATTLEDCERMVAAAKEYGRRLMIGQNQRLTDAHKKAKALIDSGAIGRPLTFRTSFSHCGPETWSVDPGRDTWFFDKKQAAMGAMADLGIHKTDLIQYLTGGVIVEVHAVLNTLHKAFSDGSPITVDDNAFCIYRMNNGVTGTMHASWTNYGHEDNSTVLYGSKGVLRIYDHPDHPLMLIRRSGEVETFDVGEIQTNDNQTRSGVIDLFVRCIQNECARYISGESVLTAMRAVFGAKESSKRGEMVRVNDAYR